MLQQTRKSISSKCFHFKVHVTRICVIELCSRLTSCEAAFIRLIGIHSEIDTSYYVLTVDLWSADGTQEVNLVRHSANAPTISSAVSSPYPPPPVPQMTFPTYPPPQQQHYQSTFAQTRQLTQGSQVPPGGQVNPYSAPQNPQGGFYHTPGTGQVATSGNYHLLQLPPGQPVPTRTPTGMFTRNLIGSLSASAFRLTDPDNKIGVWFILQDLSVRTEGMFRCVQSMPLFEITF